MALTMASEPGHPRHLPCSQARQPPRHFLPLIRGFSSGPSFALCPPPVTVTTHVDDPQRPGLSSLSSAAGPSSPLQDALPQPSAGPLATGRTPPPRATFQHGGTSHPTDSSNPLPGSLSTSHLLASRSPSTPPTQPGRVCPCHPSRVNTLRPSLARPAVHLLQAHTQATGQHPHNWADTSPCKFRFSDLKLSVSNGAQAWGSLAGPPPTPRQPAPSSPCSHTLPSTLALGTRPRPMLLGETRSTTRAQVSSAKCTPAVSAPTAAPSPPSRGRAPPSPLQGTALPRC